MSQNPEPIGTYVATVSYNGEPFSGFARQVGQPTIQGYLENSLSTLLRREVETTCAGRTDSGVHALEQVISFDRYEGDAEARLIARPLNALVGDDIVIRSVEESVLGFSARFDALSREYRYRIVCSETPPLFLHDFAWWIRRNHPLDIDAMDEAAEYLLGEHDFKSFCTAQSAIDKGTVRFLETILITYEEHLGEKCLTIRIIGNAFLHSMVRTIVGTLVEVGKGNRKPEYVQHVMDARSRAAAGQNAPAKGLTLWSVEYPDSK